MTIAEKIFEGHKTYKEEYKEDPDLLFVSSYAHEQLASSPEFNIVGYEIIRVERMQQEYRFLIHEDIEKAINTYNNAPNDPVLIRKIVSINKPEAANARRIGGEMTTKFLYIPLDIIRAYERHIGNKDLKF